MRGFFVSQIARVKNPDCEILKGFMGTKDFKKVDG
jgi:hypothetical protein